MNDEPRILKGQDIRVEDINFTRILPLPHMQPIGLLPSIPESAALWNFLVCAFQALHTVETQTTLEGNDDQTVHLMQIAESIQKQYAIQSLEAMFNPNLIRIAKREAARSKLSWDARIDRWFETGGKSFDLLDRNPDKVGQ